MVCSLWKHKAGVLAHRVERVCCYNNRATQLDNKFDGDTVSANAVMSEESNAEIAAFLNSNRSILNSQKQLLIGARDDLIGYTLRSFSIGSS